MRKPARKPPYIPLFDGWHRPSLDFLRDPTTWLWCAAAGILLLAVLICGVYSALPAAAPAPAPAPTASAAPPPTPTPPPAPTPTPTPAPAPLPSDFAGAAAQNGDMYGWIVLPGTALDYPVFSSPAGSDDFYLDHAADKSYDPYGCVFSQGAYNAAGFTDRVTVLYGHDVYTTDTGFHPLHHFEEDAAFCAEHSEVLTYTADACQHWRVLGVCNTDDAHILYENGGFAQLSVLQSWLERFTPTLDAADPALTAPQESDRYLVLSTCNQIAQNQRYLTVCVLERTEPAA